MEAIEEIVIAETTTARSQRAVAGVAVRVAIRERSRGLERGAITVTDSSYNHSLNQIHVLYYSEL